MTILQHLNKFLHAPTFQNLTQKSIEKSGRQNTTDHLCQTLHLRGVRYNLVDVHSPRPQLVRMPAVRKVVFLKFYTALITPEGIRCS